MHFLAETTANGWRPGIGDPTVMGWVTVVGYFAASWLCFRAFRSTRGIDNRRKRKASRLWRWLAIVFVLLGLNKQLDLQSLFTQIGRSMAKNEGWYAQRQDVQTAFIAALAATGVITIILLFWTMRDVWKSCGLALIGAVFIITFVIIRAASFHHIDELLGWSFLGLEMNCAFELGGIACVAIGAARNGKPAPQGRNTPALKKPPRQTEPGVVEGHVPMDSRESFQWMVQRMRK